MSRVLKRSVLGALAAALALCALGAATAGAATVDTFTLDSYHAGKKDHTPAAKSEKALKNGLYVATVKGTFSYYGAINYVVPQTPWDVLCGTPEAAPQYGSAGGIGQVGFDSEFVFARPWTTAACAAAELPVRWINFQMKTSSAGYAHPSVLNLADPENPNADHSYEYAVTGHKGHKVAFRLADIRTRDNYGSLVITIRTAVASDCAGEKYLAYGLGSEADCLDEL